MRHVVLLAILASVAGMGCGGDSVDASSLQGTVAVDGSSTVYPVTEAVAEEFRSVHPKVRVTVGISGTGGGFKKFCAGETDINDASRHIKENEKKLAADSGIDYLELPIAYDGISVVVNPGNDFVDYLTIEELGKIWAPDSTVTKWSEVREGWPDQKMTLYGPGTDSGTFDYFTEVICGKPQASRADFTASEDDNVLVKGVKGDPGALGFFGYAYYIENKADLKIVPIDAGKGPVEPTPATIGDGTYSPLSRPLFIYVRTKALERKEVQEFVTFYLEQAPTLTREVGYFPAPDEDNEQSKKLVEAAIAASTGS